MAVQMHGVGLDELEERKLIVMNVAEHHLKNFLNSKSKDLKDYKNRPVLYLHN